MPDPLAAASAIFLESQASLMAHTIRGAQNYFLRRGLDLEILIVADTYDRIKLLAPNQGATSVLQSRIRRQPNGRPKILATIFIHRHANKTLARVCIAHEIFHLLAELEFYERNGRGQWSGIPVSKTLEDACNQFAWQLCRNHDQFNRSPEARERNIYFPDHLFDAPLTTNSERQHDWPDGLALDPEHPFHRPPS